MTKSTIEQIRDALAAIDAADGWRESEDKANDYRLATNPVPMREVLAHIEALQKASQAVLDRWDSPAWEWQKHGPTADLMTALREAITTTKGQPYDQTALELCEICGWKTLIPGDCCLNCERDKATAAQPAPTVDEAIVALVSALQQSKGWLHDYADSVIRDAIDRTQTAEPNFGEQALQILAELVACIQCKGEITLHNQTAWMDKALAVVLDEQDHIAAVSKKVERQPLSDAQAQAVIDSISTYRGSYEMAVFRAAEAAHLITATSAKPAPVRGEMDLDLARAMCRSAGISLVSRDFIERFADFVSDWKKGDFTLPKYAELDMQSCFGAWQKFDPELATTPQTAQEGDAKDARLAKSHELARRLLTVATWAAGKIIVERRRGAAIAPHAEVDALVHANKSIRAWLITTGWSGGVESTPSLDEIAAIASQPARKD